MDVGPAKNTQDQLSLWDLGQAARVVRLLNSWSSAEYGMPPATVGLGSAGKLHAFPQEAIAMPRGQILHLYSLSQRLHPEQENKVEDLEGGISGLAS